MARGWRISRRTLLRGLGASLALPFLDAMAPVRAFAGEAAKAPVRMACLFFPNGVWEKTWVPEAAGADYVLPYALEPLAKHKSDFLVLSALDKANSHSGDGHYAKTANFLTGMAVTKTTGKNINVGGISMDQLCAEHVGKHTPLPSLELGIDPVISGIDSNVGYTRLYGSYISWRSPQVPVAKEINPRFVYERLFGARNAVGADAKKYADNQSLLDLVLDDANRVRGKLGRDDQFKMDEYLDSVRAVERRIEFSTKPDKREWKPTTAPEKIEAPAAGIPRDYRDHVRLMLDMMVMAFWTDSTRVSSFMFANDVSGRNFSFIEGVHGGHHDMSHHSQDPVKIEQYKKINRWHVEELAYMLEKMKAIKEGDGTLLDNSMVLFGSSMSDGNKHDPNNLPIVLAGRGGGTIKPGRHIANPKNTPLCNLYQGMIERMGVPVHSFGDSTGPLTALS